MATKKTEVAEPVNAAEQGAALAAAETTALAVVDDGFDWEADAGAGLEHADEDTFAIPFLRIVQKTSPQVDEASALYREDAKPGMFYNTVNGRLYDGKTGIHVLPCAYNRRFLRWAPRGADGASYRGEYMPEEVDNMIAAGTVKDLDGKLLFPLEDGTLDDKKCDRLSDTRTHFLILLEPDGGSSQVVFALTSTQIKKSKRLSSMLRGAILKGKNPPTWMNIIKATTAIESNDQGSWSGVQFQQDGFVDSGALYAAGKAFHDMVMRGEAKVAYEAAEEAESSPENSGGF
jgi:hypothetical protein